MIKKDWRSPSTPSYAFTFGCVQYSELNVMRKQLVAEIRAFCHELQDSLSTALGTVIFWSRFESGALRLQIRVAATPQKIAYRDVWFKLGTNQGKEHTHTHTHTHTHIYRVSQEECARLREGVPYVKVYRYNPKHLCPKLNGYGDNGQRSLKL